MGLGSLTHDLDVTASFRWHKGKFPGVSCPRRPAPGPSAPLLLGRRGEGRGVQCRLCSGTCVM